MPKRITAFLLTAAVGMLGLSGCGGSSGGGGGSGPEPNTAPSASVDVPSGLVVGEAVTFTASASDGDSDSVNQLDRLVLSYGDGSADTVGVSGRSASRDFTHTYSTPGSKTVRVTAIDRGGLTGSSSRTASVDALVEIEFDVVSAISSLVPSERLPVQDLSFEVLDQDGEVLASGGTDDGFVVSVPESSRLRADLSAPGYLPGVVALRAGDVWTANHPDSLGSFPASVGDVRALMVEDENITPFGDPAVYDDVAGLLRWYGNNIRANSSNAGWVNDVNIDVNVTSMTPQDSAAVEGGISIMSDCAGASEMSDFNEIARVRWLNRDPTEQERNNNTVWIKKRSDLPSTADGQFQHQVGVPITQENPDGHTGFYFFRIDNPAGREVYSDMVSVLGLSNAQTDEGSLVNDSGSDLARDGEIACSVVNNFPLLYQFPSDDELASVSTSSSTSYEGR